ncbi:peptide-methionine (S)-S-oxide reductase MsrA [Tropicibacter oceani]|uniref:Peptide methionine sulfoxide reductase MsrA n=1 Tax=Tropicibacter oceani TaxID=3058420 RepID=A0ABY8QIZ3_9RHOB|nr:peptide-methionine (S)-S-oxide reductase MsrA [Tropicibacter oceani]WGW04594.1 peptide-methionine (S)-S-oxide reductase MsrA [Tropicibacter oceani]
MRLPFCTRPLVLGLFILVGLAAERAHADEIIVAGGCFWCVEADFEKLRGVTEAVSGYTGGAVANPTYKQVTRGGTGHYEAVMIRFNGNQTNPRALYDLFFRSVDPTDAGGQFCDRGESYRTAIFVTNSAQKQAATEAKAAAEAQLGRKIVTPILDARPFYQAEGYHQDYYKGTKRVLTRFGPIPQKDAYKKYRDACGRDQRVKQLWGNAAAFVN